MSVYGTKMHPQKGLHPSVNDLDRLEDGLTVTIFEENQVLQIRFSEKIKSYRDGGPQGPLSVAKNVDFCLSVFQIFWIFLIFHSLF